MKPYLLLVASLFLVNVVFAQSSTIKGIIKDNKGNPIPGVNITIKDSYDGATSDSTGKYSFRTTEKGEHVLLLTSIGFKSQELKIDLKGATLEMNVELKQEITELSAVVLSAGTFEASDRKRAAAVLDPIDIVTTASGNGDITGALKTLPGAQQVGESEGLYVRGGTAAETKTFIDGTLVNNFFFSSVPNIAQFGRFSPFIFKGTVFSTGGYSALYGQALSSALILESIDLPEQSSANLGITVLSGSAGFQQLSKKKNGSWGINYNYTDLSLAFALIKQQQDYSKPPRTHNVDANFRFKTSKTGYLKYYGYFSHNSLAFTANSIDTLGYRDGFSLANTNIYQNLSYKENLANRWKINLGVSYTNNKDDIKGNLQDQQENQVQLTGLEGKNFQLKNRGNYWNAKAVLEKKLKGISAIRFGTEFNQAKDQVNFRAFNGQLYPSSLTSSISSFFAETDVYATNALAVKAGMRMEHSSLLDRTNLAPRASIAYKISKSTQASFAYGIFYQEPERRYLPGYKGMDFMRADHYILQLQKVAPGRSLRVEAFYKKYQQLQKTGVTGFTETVINNNGYGDAKGFEFFWRDKKTIKNFDYWISYSFLDTKRDFLNYPYAITPNFAAKHTLSLVAKKFIQSWKTQFNGAYNFNSGRPYYNIKLDNGSYKFTDFGRVKDYHNVSFSVNYLPLLGKKDSKNFAIYVFQVSNVFGFNQVYGYKYSYNGARKETIRPPSKIFVFIGAFLSFGVDRSQEVIDNGL